MACYGLVWLHVHAMVWYRVHGMARRGRVWHGVHAVLAWHGMHWPFRQGSYGRQRPANTVCGVNFFIMDSRRVIAPEPKVLGPKYISNPDFAPF